MFDIICVTNRALCRDNFLERLEEIASALPKAIVLREKDLSASEYEALAERALKICAGKTICILHKFKDVALKMNATALHLPLKELAQLTGEERKRFALLGASCHSVEEALQAEALGCNYLFAGHIFETDCKKGMPARGLSFLKEICKAVSLPVYAIGGMNEENLMSVKLAGARGACVMSGGMLCQNPGEYFRRLKEKV